MSRPTSGDDGSVSIWMIGLVTATFLMIALVLDGGAMLRKRSDTFGIAAAAARAGAQQLDQRQAIEGHAVLDPNAAEQAALSYLHKHQLTGTVQVTGDLVTVDAQSTAQLQMFKALGGGPVSFHATATARAVKVGTP